MKRNLVVPQPVAAIAVAVLAFAASSAGAATTKPCPSGAIETGQPGITLAYNIRTSLGPIPRLGWSQAAVCKDDVDAVVYTGAVNYLTDNENPASKFEQTLDVDYSTKATISDLVSWRFDYTVSGKTHLGYLVTAAARPSPNNFDLDGPENETVTFSFHTPVHAPPITPCMRTGTC